MKVAKRKVSELTVDELRNVIRETISEDMESWRETFEILAGPEIMRQIRQADEDWAAGSKGAYVSWDDLKRV